MIGLALVFFYLISTDYLPLLFVRQLERKYIPVRKCSTFAGNRPTLIHVLGGGYTADDQLAALSQLSQESKGRLIEAVRLLPCVPDARLVCSGNTVSGNISMAEVYREAAISLGVDSLCMVILKNPSTTQQEAQELVTEFGKDINLVVVTSALHMDRAMRYFRLLGVEPFSSANELPG